MKIKANYSFWRHPIRWIKERKLRKIMQLLLDTKRPELEGEMRKAMVEQWLYGRVFIKNGKVVPRDHILQLTNSPH